MEGACSLWIGSGGIPASNAVIKKGLAMKLRSLGMSTLVAALLVSTVVALRAADEKPKAKATKPAAAKEPAAVKDPASKPAVGTKPAADAKSADGTKPADEALPPGVVKFSTAPAPVQKTFLDEVKGGKIELLGKGKNDDGGVFYKALIGMAAGNYEVAVAENGTLLEKILQMESGDIAVDECPAPVLKTLKEEGKGAKIEAVEKVAEGNRLHFIADVMIQKTKYQIIVMEDGTLISKVIDYDKAEELVPAPVEAKAPTKTGTPRKN